MQIIAILLATVIGVIVVGGSAWSAIISMKCEGSRNTCLVVSLGYALVTFGGIGFFGLAFSSFGGLRWLPTTFEWPVGFVRGSLTMHDGTHVVPVELAGNRIQIYSPEWRFVRAWYVPHGGGGRIHLQLKETNVIEIITRSDSMRYLYDINGSLLSEKSYIPKKFVDFPGSKESDTVPTPWWLWMLTSPLNSWLVFAGGMIVLILTSKNKKNTASGSVQN